MNEKSFTKYLATGEYVPTEDSAPVDLAAHDNVWHPNGFDPKKDHCGLREQMAKKDDSDKIRSFEGEQEDKRDPYKEAKELGYLGGRENAEKWLSGAEAQDRKDTLKNLLVVTKGDRDKAREMLEEVTDLKGAFNDRGSQERKKALEKELGESEEAKAVMKKIDTEWDKAYKDLSSYYSGNGNWTGD